MFEAPESEDFDTSVLGTTVFYIPVDNFQKFEAKIAAISRRAVRFGGEEITACVIGRATRQDPKGLDYDVYEVLLTADPPRVAGWTFVARLDHSNDTGNIIRKVPYTVPLEDVPGFRSKTPEEREIALQNAAKRICVPVEYRTVAPNCQHCNVRRQRRDTFLLREDTTGRFMQVGSTCLVDFFDGQDPTKAAKMAEFLGYAVEVGRGFENDLPDRGMIDRRFVVLSDYLAHAAFNVRKNGWVSGGEAYRAEKEGRTDVVSTRERADNDYFDRKRPAALDPTDEDRATAEAALEWARTLKGVSDYEHAVLVIANAEMIEPRNTGIAASIVGVYVKNRARAEAEKKVAGDGLTRLFNMFEAAKRNKLQRPKITLGMGAEEFVVSPAGEQSSNAGALYVKRSYTHGGDYLGKIMPDGTPRFRDLRALEAIRRFAADPVGSATEHGRLTGRCCLCNRPLSDEKSTERGFGPICARKFEIEAVS